MPDHVHMLVSLYPSYAPLEMVKQLKYYTANILKQEYPDIKNESLAYGLEAVLFQLLVVLHLMQLNNT